jgi:D-amino-acid dehydrogenase
MPIICADHHYAFTPMGTGLRLVGTSELAGLAAPPDYTKSERTTTAARLAFPELNKRGGRAWMAFRPSTPDSLPVIGRTPGHPNVYLAFGHGHKGLGQAAITGRLISELVEGTDPVIDVEPLRPTRFACTGPFRIRPFAKRIDV